MNSDATDQWNRRDALRGGAAALFVLMRDAAGTVRAAADKAIADARYPFAERLSDLVIPGTDTPGAAGTGVAAFVLLAVDHHMTDLKPELLERVRGALDAAAQGDFLKLPRGRQQELLEVLDTQAFASHGAAPDTPHHAWQRIKAAIVAGYYTSEAGASKELVFEPVPGDASHNITLTGTYRSRSNDGLGGAF